MAAAQTALDAMAMGRRVVWRMRREEFDFEYPALSAISPYIHFYQSRGELTEHVAKLASVPLGSLAQDRESMRLVRSEHTVVNRLLAIAKALR